MILEIIDVINLIYRKFFLQAKIIFYTKYVKLEIIYIKILITYSCQYINRLELDLKYLKRLNKNFSKGYKYPYSYKYMAMRYLL